MTIKIFYIINFFLKYFFLNDLIQLISNTMIFFFWLQYLIQNKLKAV